MFVSTDSTSRHEFASQFGLASNYNRSNDVARNRLLNRLMLLSPKSQVNSIQLNTFEHYTKIQEF